MNLSFSSLARNSKSYKTCFLIVYYFNNIVEIINYYILFIKLQIKSHIDHVYFIQNIYIITYLWKCISQVLIRVYQKYNKLQHQIKFLLFTHCGIIGVIFLKKNLTSKCFRIFLYYLQVVLVKQNIKFIRNYHNIGVYEDKVPTYTTSVINI